MRKSTVDFILPQALYSMYGSNVTICTLTVAAASHASSHMLPSICPTVDLLCFQHPVFSCYQIRELITNAHV